MDFKYSIRSFFSWPVNRSLKTPPRYVSALINDPILQLGGFATVILLPTLDFP
jgi:hypothetical protein